MMKYDRYKNSLIYENLKKIERKRSVSKKGGYYEIDLLTLFLIEREDARL